MIYTITLNPSLDYLVSVPDFSIGKTNRTKEEAYLPGGKGINVSCVLRHLGIDSTALGFTAGFVGEEITRRIQSYGIRSCFTQLPEGNSRINVKLLGLDGTEINAGGPHIPQAAIAGLMDVLRQLGPSDTLVLAGSVPPSVSSDIYKKLAHLAGSRGCRVVVDAAGELLCQVLPEGPYLIKPNLQELQELSGRTLHTAEEIADCARQLQKQGAENVLVSMGADGALLVSETGAVYSCEAPKGQVRNSVGAGDSMVAGFLAGIYQGKSIREAFLLSVAAGSASAFSANLAEAEEIFSLYRILVEKT